MNNSQTLHPVITITAENFEAEVLNNETPILLDFWAPWCGPCRAMGPILDQVSTQLAGKVRVGKVNVDNEQSLAAAFGVQSIPTLVLMQQNKALDAWMGVAPADHVVERIQKNLVP